MSDAVEKVANAKQEPPERTWIDWPNPNSAGLAFSCQARPPARRTEYVRVDALKSLGWLSPEDLEARDAEVTRMALDMAAKVASNLTQKPSMVDEAYQTYQLCRHNHGNEIAASILALKSTPATGMKLVPEVPTEAMLKAGSIAFYDSKQDVLAARLPEAYRAMLAAVTVKP